MKKSFDLESLNRFLKTLKGGSNRLERYRQYIERLEFDKSEKAEVVRKTFEEECEEYYKLEDRLYTLLNDLSEEERDIIVSHYILGISVEKLAKSYFVDRVTLYRWIEKIKIILVKKWVK